MWGGLFALFVTVLMFARREGRFDAVEELLAAVSHMRVSDFLRKLLGLSPTSPKPRAMRGGGVRNSRGHGVVPVEVAQKGLGQAGSVPVPEDLWNRLIDPEPVEAMGSIKVPCKELTEAESAMVLALENQGHLVPLAPHMPGYGKPPSAPIFIIPKTAEKCSLILTLVTEASFTNSPFSQFLRARPFPVPVDFLTHHLINNKRAAEKNTLWLALYTLSTPLPQHLCRHNATHTIAARSGPSLPSHCRIATSSVDAIHALHTNATVRVSIEDTK